MNDKIQKTIICLYNSNDLIDKGMFQLAIKNERLNDKASIHFLYEDWENVVTIETGETETQHIINRKLIDKADIVVAIVGAKIYDTYLKDEIDYILNLRNSNNKPKLLIYFKSLILDSNNEDDIVIFKKRIKFVKYIKNKRGYRNIFYYKTYENSSDKEKRIQPFRELEAIFVKIFKDSSLWFEEEIEKRENLLKKQKEINMDMNIDNILGNKEKK